MSSTSPGPEPADWTKDERFINWSICPRTYVTTPCRQHSAFFIANQEATHCALILNGIPRIKMEMLNGRDSLARIEQDRCSIEEQMRQEAIASDETDTPSQCDDEVCDIDQESEADEADDENDEEVSGIDFADLELFLSRDGKVVAFSYYDSGITKTCVVSGRSLKQYVGDMECAMFSDDGKRLLITLVSDDNDAFYVLDDQLCSGVVLSTIFTPDSKHAICLVRDEEENIAHLIHNGEKLASMFCPLSWSDDMSESPSSENRSSLSVDPQSRYCLLSVLMHERSEPSVLILDLKSNEIRSWEKARIASSRWLPEADCFELQILRPCDNYRSLATMRVPVIIDPNMN